MRCKGVRSDALRTALLFLLGSAFLWPSGAQAQDNYEIQVYPSETMAPKTLLVELHSNFTVEGTTTTDFGMLPTQHQQHEAIKRRDRGDETLREIARSYDVSHSTISRLA